MHFTEQHVKAEQKDDGGGGKPSDEFHTTRQSQTIHFLPVEQTKKRKKKAINIISRPLTAAPAHYPVSVGLHRRSATPRSAPGMYNQPSPGLVL